jgi:hypothetical protein
VDRECQSTGPNRPGCRPDRHSRCRTRRRRRARSTSHPLEWSPDGRIAVTGDRSHLGSSMRNCRGRRVNSWRSRRSVTDHRRSPGHSAQQFRQIDTERSTLSVAVELVRTVVVDNPRNQESLVAVHEFTRRVAALVVSPRVRRAAPDRPATFGPVGADASAHPKRRTGSRPLQFGCQRPRGPLNR